MSDGKIPKNKSIINLDKLNNIKFTLSKVAKNKMILLSDALNNKCLNYCPTCKNKNMPKEVHLTFDLIFCSIKCRNKMCDGINMEELIKFRNFKEV